MEDYWTLEDEEDNYLKEWKQKYNQNHKVESFESLRANSREEKKYP